MPINNKRFVLSFLNKDRYNDSFNEELLCDEKTGEVLIKTKDGDIVSYNSSARYKEHIETFTTVLKSHNFIGDIFSVDNSIRPFPGMYESGISFIDEPVELNTISNNMYISIDYDYVDIQEQGMTNDFDNETLRCEVTLSLQSSGVKIDDSVIEINPMTINRLSAIDGSIAIENMTLSSIRGFTQYGKRLIVHSILIAYGKDTVVEEADASDFLYSIYDDSVSILLYRGDDKIVKIPSTIEGYNVTKIEATAFNGFDEIEAVFIPNTVKVIN
jgi:hypothetical protein